MGINFPLYCQFIMGDIMRREVTTTVVPSTGVVQLSAEKCNYKVEWKIDADGLHTTGASKSTCTDLRSYM